MNENLTIVDTHVHVYVGFSLPKFLDAAHCNFTVQAQRQQAVSFTGVLLFTESQGAQWFEHLVACADKGIALHDEQSAGWTMQRTAEKISLKAESTRGAQLFIVAGRQIVTKEKLEVLALLTESVFPDGSSLQDTVQAIRNNGGIPVIPWGFGKWWGQRGRVLADFLASQKAGDIFLGDNSGRPSFLPEPSHFVQAKRQGLQILPGSDPLPIPTEYWRPGCAGLTLTERMNSETPAEDLKRLLLNSQTTLMTYHQPDSLFRFAKNFIGLRMMKH